jgi:hypothetical protein
MKLEFSRQTSEKSSDINLMKICQLGAELFHADGQTDGQTEGDMTKLLVAFRTFANAPKMILSKNVNSHSKSLSLTWINYYVKDNITNCTLKEISSRP